MQKKARKRRSYSGNESILQKWPPCKECSLCMMVSLAQKINFRSGPEAEQTGTEWGTVGDAAAITRSDEAVSLEVFSMAETET